VYYICVAARWIMSSNARGGWQFGDNVEFRGGAVLRTASRFAIWVPFHSVSSAYHRRGTYYNARSERVTAWVTERVTAWVTERVTAWGHGEGHSVGSRRGSQRGSITAWVTERVTAWVTERVTAWGNSVSA